MGARLKSKRDQLTVPGPEAVAAGLPTVREELVPLLRRGCAELGCGDSLDLPADEIFRRVAEHVPDAAGRRHVHAVIVRDEHELLGVIRKGRVLISQPGPYDVQSGGVDLRGRSRPLPAPFRGSPIGKEIGN